MLDTRVIARPREQRMMAGLHLLISISVNRFRQAGALLSPKPDPLSAKYQQCSRVSLSQIALQLSTVDGAEYIYIYILDGKKWFE